MPTLSLDCLTLTDTSPADLIRAADAAGFDLVSLWVSDPPVYPRMRLLPEMERECAALLADCGVGVHSLEAFDLASEQAVEDHRPALEMGARLGAKAAIAYNGGLSDLGRVADLLASFAGVAGEFGLGVVFEPIAVTQTCTLAEAQSLIRKAGVDAGILFDTWHLFRTGGGIAEFRAIDPALIRYLQINDGMADIAEEEMLPEVMGERLYPGKGEFPLVELLRLVPDDIPWGIETPSLGRANAGVSPQEQAREAMEAMQRLLAEVRREPEDVGEMTP
jgi:sugar phosphate isomerase/epimerase